MRQTAEVNRTKFDWKAPVIVVAGLASALAVIWLVQGFIPYPTPDNLPTRWDHYRYIAMAQNPFGSDDPLVREAPYSWRILTPWLVYFSPLPWRVSFMLLTLVGLGGGAYVLYLYLRHQGYSEAAGIFGLGLFFSLGGLIFNLEDFYLSDPLALLAVAALFFWLWPLQANSTTKGFVGVREWWPGLVILCLGVTAKETVAAALVMIMTANRLSWQAKLVLWLVPLAVLVGIRIILPSSNNYSIFGEMNDVLSNQFFGNGLSTLAARLNFAFLGTWGPALVLVFYHPIETLVYFKERWLEMVFLIIIYGQLFIAHNVDRLLVYGFIVVIPLLVCKAAQLSEVTRIPLYGLLVGGMALQLGYFYGRPPVWLSLLVCLGLAGWLLALSRPKKFATKG